MINQIKKKSNVNIPQGNLNLSKYLVKISNSPLIYSLKRLSEKLNVE